MRNDIDNITTECSLVSGGLLTAYSELARTHCVQRRLVRFRCYTGAAVGLDFNFRFGEGRPQHHSVADDTNVRAVPVVNVNEYLSHVTANI